MEKISFYKKRAKEIIYLLDNICCDITFIRDLNPVQIQIIKSGKKVKRGSGYDHNSQKKKALTLDSHAWPVYLG